MKFGVSLQLKSPVVTRDALRRVAQTAERLGYDWLAVNDRVIHAVEINSHYPYTESGKVGSHFLKNDGQLNAETLETLSTMSFLAACTERLTIASMILVLPYRPPVLAAKMLATVDVLSEGRVIAGVGAGWMEEEFTALQRPHYRKRGKLLDEYLEAFRVLFTEPEPSYEGEFVAFDGIVFEPKPVAGTIPIWIAGESPAALRRVARFADGWCPGTTSPTLPLDTVQGFSAAMDRLRRACDAEGRDADEIDIVLYPSQYAPDSSPGARVPFYGEADAIAEDIAQYEAEGLTGLTLRLLRDDLEETIDEIERYAEDVIAPLHQR